MHQLMDLLQANQCFKGTYSYPQNKPKTALILVKNSLMSDFNLRLGIVAKYFCYVLNY